MKDKIKTFFESNWTLSEKILLVTDVLLLGVVIGWLTSPLKNGIGICSNNTWDICNHKPCGECEEEEKEN